MLTGKQKRFLRSQGMTMKPLINVGKNGMSESFSDGVLKAIETRELIKISLLQAAETTPKEVGAYLADAIDGLEVAQTIGRTLLVYRKATDPDNRDISTKIAKL
ncbi:YhbY family RNA-binding protein [Lacticaseibacillus saniviri]|uniref:CRM domain-containing protein n=1 Tax=Lacticaseibacillus saniviri JCM 17471 = DSM 24301 TaxID=1293598 RepID=A0A0R2N395_9LACO|nr:YhbY family RNA-binding protein [Lacticaseibacillus saniviri]KRO18525.1 hypothetical protein IV56_GL000801 [Lacticaseibacillus saniviri JCM 17471 = DSM 24301]MCG4282035.1 YhbY family RNA-binding protein [Lacticaseibacillus saniviri]